MFQPARGSGAALAQIGYDPAGRRASVETKPYGSELCRYYLIDARSARLSEITNAK
jgi:hypothetical protein